MVTVKKENRSKFISMFLNNAEMYLFVGRSKCREEGRDAGNRPRS